MENTKVTKTDGTSTENKIQQSMFLWFNNNYTVNGLGLFASIPNDSKDAKEQMFKKATGLMSGVSDLICINNGEVLFIECKDDKGKQSDKQKEFENIVSLQCFKYFLVRSLDEFKKIIILAE